MRQIEELRAYPAIHRIFGLFQEQRDAVFLDSSLKNGLGQYSIIGLYPYLKLVNGGIFLPPTGNSRRVPLRNT